MRASTCRSRPARRSGLLGHNGAGKTTAVRILATLLRPDGGRALVGGHDVVHEPAAVRSQISLAGQQATLDERLTGRENLVLLARLQRVGANAARRRSTELLERLQLAEAADRQVGTYSLGMRRRLDLAACLLVPRPVVFLDEPTTGLDPASRAEVWSAVRAQVDGGAAVLLTTQYLEEADRLADRITVLSAGRVVAEGTPDALKNRVGGRRVAAVLTCPDDLEAAAAALADADLHPAVDPRELIVSAAAPHGADDLGHVLAALARAGVRVKPAQRGRHRAPRAVPQPRASRLRRLAAHPPHPRHRHVVRRAHRAVRPACGAPVPPHGRRLAPPSARDRGSRDGERMARASYTCGVPARVALGPTTRARLPGSIRPEHATRPRPSEPRMRAP